MLTPDQIASSNTEHGHQSGFFAALIQDPRCPRSHPLWQSVVRWAHAVPNGGDRDVITAGKLKAEGVKPGVWDVFVPVPVWRPSPFDTFQTQWRHGLYLEFKKPTRRKQPHGGLSDSQLEYGRYLLSVGYHAAVVYTWEEALLETIKYIEGRW